MDESGEFDYGDLDAVVRDIRRVAEAGVGGYHDARELVETYCEEAEWQEGAAFSAADKAELLRRYVEAYGDEDDDEGDDEIGGE